MHKVRALMGCHTPHRIRRATTPASAANTLPTRTTVRRRAARHQPGKVDSPRPAAGHERPPALLDELTAFYLARIHRLNPQLHAVIATNPDALQEAIQSDVHRFVHGSRGPLDGIPVLVKDNVAFDHVATAGSEALLKAKPAEAFLMKRLRDAGAVVIGKANLSEWRTSARSRPPAGGARPAD